MRGGRGCFERGAGGDGEGRVRGVHGAALGARDAAFVGLGAVGEARGGGRGDGHGVGLDPVPLGEVQRGGMWKRERIVVEPGTVERDGDGVKQGEGLEGEAWSVLVGGSKTDLGLGRVGVADGILDFTDERGGDAQHADDEKESGCELDQAPRHARGFP